MDIPKFLGAYPFEDSNDSQFINIELDDKARDMFNLMKGNTVKLYLHLIRLKNKDEKFVYFNDREEYKRKTQIKADLTIKNCLNELVNHGLIAYTGQNNFFWINHNYTRC